MDIYLFCHYKNIEFIYDRSRVTKLKANFVLNNNTRLFIYKWLKSLCFPDGHT